MSAPGTSHRFDAARQLSRHSTEPNVSPRHHLTVIVLAITGARPRERGLVGAISVADRTKPIL